MADVAAAPKADEQVPLDTIPISPSDANGSSDKPSTSSTANGDSDVRTVFDDPENFNVKHPLMNNWTLWFTKPPSGKGDNWAELLKEVISFDSVEEFWGIYNNITATSELAQKSDYHLFKKGVRPEWEDAQNKHGGKWAFQFKDKKAINIDALWLHVMLAAIGENLEDEDDNEVMGVVVNVRRGFYRIGLWTRTVGRSLPGEQGKGKTVEQSKETLMKLGRRFKAALQLKENDPVEFSGHTDSAHAGSTRAKAKFSV
ncbi:eukaryotic translation initiation factor 4E [Amniculicola lignicola CBS 123094]|uniref:Eukaryotic translation initiation factor 4E n=1 Tax=Amniculicola lignicola CBS 123094 TaxID=1392246 RepID=A0A6A5WZU9_9PLEO|nr:eukaryotic translation initiation factor 4E [Amniculicola lignicola CBS 123094]